jgi:hypothetical protein
MNRSQPVAQRQMVYNHLKRGRKLNPIDALNIYGILRLAARIHELREEGHQIHTQMCDGYGSYSLARMKKS